MLVIYLTLPMTAAMSQAVKADEIRAMVNDKTWEIVFQDATRKTGYFTRTTFWDWKQDGTICARLMGVAKTDPCLDEGRWRLDGQYLCWQLTWAAKSWGMNKKCISIRRTPDGKFEAQWRKLVGVKYFNFSVLN